MKRLILAALLMATPAALFAQAAALPSTSAEGIEPARLAAARAMVDAMMPPAQRATMMRGMIEPVIANMRSTMARSPELAELIEAKPGAQAIIDRYVDRQMDVSFASVEASLPQLFDAMAIAYARQFTVPQLQEVTAFYASPTGRATIEKAPQIMADPAVMAVQRDMMARSMEGVPEMTQALTAELLALFEQDVGDQRPATGPATEGSKE